MNRWLKICFMALFTLWFASAIAQNLEKRNPPSANQPLSPPAKDAVCFDAENVPWPEGLEQFKIDLRSADCWSGWNTLPGDWPRFEGNAQSKNGICIQFLGNEPRCLSPKDFLDCDRRENEKYCEDPWFRPLGGGKVVRVAGEGTITFWKADRLEKIEKVQKAEPPPQESSRQEPPLQP